MKRLLNNVAAFQQAYGAPCFKDRKSAEASGEMTPALAQLRVRIIMEEIGELLHSFGASETAMDMFAETMTVLSHEELHLADPVEAADAIIDSIYVLVGTGLSYGIPLDRVWHEVQRTNMAKFPGGKALKDEGGKVIKPEGWKPPEIAAAMACPTKAAWMKDES